MKTETRTIHRCDHCNKVYFVQKACEKHEKKCKSNPDNHAACFGCKFLSLKECYIPMSNGYSDWEHSISLCFCSKKGGLVVPLNKDFLDSTAYCKTTDEEMAEEWMPKECDMFVLNGMNDN